jgi:tRNA(fMet)-specific endonuclease VapC
MILLDADILTLLFAGNEIVRVRADQQEGEFGIPIITRIQVLRGRFEALLKAADGAELVRAMVRLEQSERYLEELVVTPVDDKAAAEFDRLRQHKKLKKIGRGDLLIASIALANHATLVTRNLRHFRQIPGLKLENWAD